MVYRLFEVCTIYGVKSLEFKNKLNLETFKKNKGQL